jgi:hypothetical protein
MFLGMTSSAEALPEKMRALEDRFGRKWLRVPKIVNPNAIEVGKAIASRRFATARYNGLGTSRRPNKGWKFRLKVYPRREDHHTSGRDRRHQTNGSRLRRNFFLRSIRKRETTEGSMTERRPVDILRHEAGHMVVAKLLGFETESLIYTKLSAGAGLALAPALSDIESVISYVERRMSVLYAGSMAEALSNGEVDGDKALLLLKGSTKPDAPPKADAPASDDYSKVRELARILAALMRSERNVADILKENEERVWLKAGTLVEKYAEQIESVARTWRQKLGGLDEIAISKEETNAIPEFASLQWGSEI